jgi:biotin synthase
MKAEILKTALDKGLGNVGLNTEEALEFTALPGDRFFEILAVTDRVRRRHKGIEISLCSIVNAKSGLCKEDCTFCSQSVGYSTDIKSYPMLASDEILESALEARKNGAREFSIVTSGTGLEKDRDIKTLLSTLKEMSATVDMERCASLGILTRETLQNLKDSGLESYHHNLETSRSFFPEICTTHSYEEDVEVVRTAKDLGLYVCSGGVFGLGETWADRVELASTLKDLKVDSVPVNFLNPRPGTPLEKADNLTPIECLKIIALLRLMMPDIEIIVCGGRDKNLGELQPLIFAAGASGMMIGNYLTTPGRNPEQDLKMIKDMGLKRRGA